MFSGNTSYSCPTETTWNKTLWEKVLLITQVLEGHDYLCVERHSSFTGLLSTALHQQWDTKKSWVFYASRRKKKKVFNRCRLKEQLCIFRCRSSSPLWNWKSGCEQHCQGMQWAGGRGCEGAPHSCRQLHGVVLPRAKATGTWVWPERANPTALGKQKASN